MMLPEYTEALSKHREKILEEENNNIPDVDDQELELWERWIKQSLEHGREITVTYLSKDGEKTLAGAVIKIDLPAGRITMAGRGGRIEVEVKKITSIKG
jgi:hypothetical protein